MCIVQGVPCVLYKVCRVYFSRCAGCLVICVQCVMYKVFSVYCALRPAKYSVNKEDSDLKSIII